jgi:hypothetical protein
MDALEISHVVNNWLIHLFIEQDFIYWVQHYFIGVYQLPKAPFNRSKEEFLHCLILHESHEWNFGSHPKDLVLVQCRVEYFDVLARSYFVPVLVSPWVEFKS